jgi:hypothetical protein
VVLLFKLSDYFCWISTKELSGISFVTTDPAPITHPFQSLYRDKLPNCHLSSNRRQLLWVRHFQVFFLFRHLVGEWRVQLYSGQNTLEPIVTLVQSKNTVYIEENIVSTMDVVTITKKKEVQYKDLLLHSESVLLLFLLLF